jgi:hypothetical protein
LLIEMIAKGFESFDSLSRARLHGQAAASGSLFTKRIGGVGTLPMYELFF